MGHMRLAERSSICKAIYCTLNKIVIDNKVPIWVKILFRASNEFYVMRNNIWKGLSSRATLQESVRMVFLFACQQRMVVLWLSAAGRRGESVSPYRLRRNRIFRYLTCPLLISRAAFVSGASLQGLHQAEINWWLLTSSLYPVILYFPVQGSA